MADASAYSIILAGLTASLTRTGVNVGGTAGYPRIEIHSITEGESADKDGAVRTFSATIESMTNDSRRKCAALNEENERRLLRAPLDLEDDGYRCVGVIIRGLQDMQETSDTQSIIYRALLSVDVIVERLEEIGDDTEADNESQTE